MKKLGLALLIISFVHGSLLAANVASISIADCVGLNMQEATIIDVRYSIDYRRGHVEGAISLPYYRLDKIDLPKDRPIVTYCSGIGCSLSMDAASKLRDMGYTNVRYLLGGISEWEMKGHPIVRDKVDVKPAGPGLFETVDVAPKLVNANLTKVFILDTRPQPEFDAGHLPNAWNVPLERLLEGMGELSGEVIVCDRQPKRWKRAVTLLKEAGYDAHGLSGGIGAWSGSGFALVTGAGTR